MAAAQSATIVHLDSRLSCPGAAQFIASRFVTFHALIAVPYLRVVASVAHHGILTRSAVRTSSCTAGNQSAQDDLSDHFGKVVHKKILLVPSEATQSECQVALQTDCSRSDWPCRASACAESRRWSARARLVPAGTSDGWQTLNANPRPVCCQGAAGPHPATPAPPLSPRQARLPEMPSGRGRGSA